MQQNPLHTCTSQTELPVNAFPAAYAMQLKIPLLKTNLISEITPLRDPRLHPAQLQWRAAEADRLGQGLDQISVARVPAAQPPHLLLAH